MIVICLKNLGQQHGRTLVCRITKFGAWDSILLDESRITVLCLLYNDYHLNLRIKKKLLADSFIVYNHFKFNLIRIHTYISL